MNTYLQAFKNYADFSGRATRREYWVFYIFNLALTVIAAMLDNVFEIAWGELGYGPIYTLYALGVLIPSLAVTVRRLHDVGKSGWMILVALIPLVGPIWLIVLLAMAGDSSENEYGPVPEGIQNVPASDEMIFLSIVWALISMVMWVILPRISFEHYESPLFDVGGRFMPLVGGGVFLGLALAVNSRTLRIVLIIVAVLMLLTNLYFIAERMEMFG